MTSEDRSTVITSQQGNPISRANNKQATTEQPFLSLDAVLKQNQNDIKIITCWTVEQDASCIHHQQE